MYVFCSFLFLKLWEWTLPVVAYTECTCGRLWWRAKFYHCLHTRVCNTMLLLRYLLCDATSWLTSSSVCKQSASENYNIDINVVESFLANACFISQLCWIKWKTTSEPEMQSFSCKYQIVMSQSAIPCCRDIERSTLHELCFSLFWAICCPQCFLSISNM